MVRIYFLGSKDSPLRRTRIYDLKYDNTEGYVERQYSFEKYMVYDNIRNKNMRTKSSGSNRHISTVPVIFQTDYMRIKDQEKLIIEQ
jgi:hypothetical protein